MKKIIICLLWGLVTGFVFFVIGSLIDAIEPVPFGLGGFLGAFIGGLIIFKDDKKNRRNKK